MDNANSPNVYPAQYIQAPPIPSKYDQQQQQHDKNKSDHILVNKIRKFSENTTAHGVRRVFIAKNGCTARLWLFGILFCFAILIIQANHLVNKFTRYEKITTIELKFDNVLYPAITFCNLNPYKRSLIRLVPSVKDTMDVYENAKWMSKKNRQNRPRTDSLSYGAVEDKLKVLELFKDEILQAYHESDHQDDHSTNSSTKLNERDGAKNIPTDEFNQQILDQNMEMNQNQRFRKEPAIWANQETRDSSTQHHRSRREIPRRRYEAIEAHCKCIGTMDMECIRFESVPLSNDAKCICTFDREMNVAWPCFNISVWQDEECPVCAEDGHCEPKSNENVISVNWPCMCRRRQSDTKPYCIAKRMNILKLWTAHPDWEQNEMHWPSSTTSTTTTTTSTPSTTVLPSTEDDEYRRKKNQSARVSAPETVKAMGFTGMTDGVAMLTRAKENLIFTMSALSKMQRIALSHSKRDFIEMCSFDGKQCDIDKDFKLHVDPEFGNCYTFNWGINNNYTSSRAGPMYGIRILLFVNISDYMATSESTGVRIAVHSPTEFPFPDTFGYSAPIGFASSFGLRKQVVKKLGAPYGDCEVRKKMNSSWYIYSDYDYNPEGCHRSCFQNVLLEKCGCGDPRFPVPKGLKHCSAFNASARACLERSILEVGDFHHLTTDLQDCECRQPCEHESFTVTFSTSKWPSNINDLADCGDMGEEECSAYYGRNAAMVQVYYEQLNYELLKESEAYGLVNLLADIGGHLGLWMGFSVITIIEWVVLVFDLVTICCDRRNRRHNQLIQSQPIANLNPHSKTSTDPPEATLYGNIIDNNGRENSTSKKFQL